MKISSSQSRLRSCQQRWMGLVPTRDIDEETTGGDYLFAFNVVFFHPCTFSLFIQHLPHPILRPKQKNRPGQIKSARPPQPCLYIGRRSRLTGQIRRARLDLIKEKLSLFSIVPWWARKYRVGRAREWGPPLRRKKDKGTIIRKCVAGRATTERMRCAGRGIPAPILLFASRY